ncbi:MAG: diacylglycerol kinase family lipid kinase [Acidobacteriota bacterium]
MKRFCLIANPAAGRTRHFTLLNTVRTLLDRAGLDHDLQVTQAPGLGITLSMAAAESGYAGVIAYGGDGTVSEVASGVVGTGLNLGVIPGGTMNLFAQELGLPSRLEEAVRIVAAGRTRKVEVGKVAGRYFILCAGAGVDAAVVRTLPRSVKKKIGKLAYYLRAPMAAVRYPFPLIRVVTDDGVTLQGAQVIISNCREYGDRFLIAPGASPFDGVMDGCVFRGRRLRNFLRYYIAVRRGRHLLEADVEYYKGRRFLLRPVVEGASVPLQIDGDYLCDLPAEIEVVPAALPVYVPD